MANPTIKQYSFGNGSLSGTGKIGTKGGYFSRGGTFLRFYFQSNNRKKSVALGQHSGKYIIVALEDGNSGIGANTLRNYGGTDATENWIGQSFTYATPFSNNSGRYEEVTPSPTIRDNPVKALVYYVRQIDTTTYHNILEGTYALLCFGWGGIAYLRPGDLPKIHRGDKVNYSVYGKTSTVSYGGTLNISYTYSNRTGYHFYYNSCVLSGNVAWNSYPNKYAIYNTSTYDLILNPATASSTLNTYEAKLESLGSTKMAIIQLQKDSSDPPIGYTKLTYNQLKTIVGNDDSSSTSASSSVSDIDTSTVYDVLDPESTSFSSPVYATELNNWKLYFVPGKDKRTSGNYLGREIAKTTPTTTSGGLSYYTPANNTILCLRAKTGDDIIGDENATEPLSKFNTKSSYELEDFAKELDEYFHYRKTEFIWSTNGNVFPGLTTGKTTGDDDTTSYLKIDSSKFNSDDYYYYYKKRVPTMGAIVVPKSYNFEEEDFGWDLLYELVKRKISFKNYFTMSAESKINYRTIYYTITFGSYEDFQKARKSKNVKDVLTVALSTNESFSTFISTIMPTMERATLVSYDIETSVEQERGSINLYDFQLLEAYTRGHDFIQETYTTVRAKERNPDNNSDTSRLMSYDDNYFTYKYTGREIDITNQSKNDKNFALIHEKDLLLEDDVTLGESYGEQQYFIEAIKYENKGNNSATYPYLYKDTFKVTDFVEAVDNTQYIEEDLKILTAKIDLLQCKYYDPNNATFENNWFDCCYGSDDDKTAIRECIYQKLGECPYRFCAEKHPRKIRTLEQSKSNRFSLIQETSKVFEYYPQFYIEYNNNGKVKTNDNGKMLKHVFYMKEKGAEKYSGFRYEKNLSSISRAIDSNSITTKLYVESVDSDLTDTGTCTIQTATDNIGKNSYILDFTYYTKKGLLNPEQTQRDIYGIDSGDLAFLPTIGAYNSKYDDYSTLIINMTGEEMTTLQASNEVALTGIETALEERQKVGQQLYQFKTTKESVTKYTDGALTTTVTTVSTTSTNSYITSDTYQSYLVKYREQAITLWGLVEQLFFSDNYFTYCYIDTNDVVHTENINYTYLPTSGVFVSKGCDDLINQYRDTYCKGELFWRLTLEGFKDIDEDSTYEPPFESWNEFKEKIVDTYKYPTNGDIGQYKSLYEEVKYWKLERAKVLRKINEISEKFYKIYEPYIKEGTWTDSNYLTDNEYYWAAESVLSDSSKPNISYTINVIDISPLEVYNDDYTFELGDTTYVEDIDFFGVSSITGLPNREKVLISAIEDSLDKPEENSITVQNYTTAFDDLFETVTATVQSLTYNENTYKRSSNFTAKQYIQSDSLQGTLDEGDLTLIDANDSNVVLDDGGAQGNAIDNSASQYKLSGEGLFFSKDGGQTWDLGVGPKGLNLDYAKFGSLDASKVQIVDGQYIYFLWDKNGINAYRNPSTSTSGLVDFARFNKYGLSLIENNNIRLRAGYEFKNNGDSSNSSGLYSTEEDLTNQNIGFYLYNDNGQPIFKTETRSDYNDSSTDYSARLSLTGEMYITNKVLDTDDDGSVLTTTKANQLSGGYYLLPTKISSLTESSYGDVMAASLDNYYFSENNSSTLSITPDYDNISNLSIITVQVVKVINRTSANSSSSYYKFDDTTSLYKGALSNVKTVVLDYYLFDLIYIGEITNSITLTATTLINNRNNKVITLDDNDWNINSSLSGTATGKYVKLNSNAYVIDTETVNIYQSYSSSATTKAPSSTTAKSVMYYNTSDSSPYSATTKTLYQYNGGFYNYWENSTVTNSTIAATSSNTSTQEVGIFINNKKNLSDSTTSINIADDDNDEVSSVTLGSERLFTIALKGTSDNGEIYQNVLSVLKNGNLYMGGEIKDKVKQSLKIDGFKYLPDEISITNPTIVMSNEGSIWCNWRKFYNLTEDGQLGNTSLYDVVTNVQDYITSDSSSGTSLVSAGWYIIDPIEG